MVELNVLKTPVTTVMFTGVFMFSSYNRQK